MKTEDDMGTAAATTANVIKQENDLQVERSTKAKPHSCKWGSKRNFGYQGTVSITGRGGQKDTETLILAY